MAEWALSSQLPVFWSFRRCPYAMRARLALKSSGQQVWLREILLRDKPSAFLSVAEDGTVPVLVLENGDILQESRDIMRWALERADPEGWLEGLAETQIDQHFELLDGPFKYHLDRYKYASRHDPGAALSHRAEASLILDSWNRQLARNKALSARGPGLLDYASLPFVRQFRIADPVWFDGCDWPALQKWLGDFLASDRLARIMAKYRLWQAGEPGHIF